MNDRTVVAPDDLQGQVQNLLVRLRSGQTTAARVRALALLGDRSARALVPPSQERAREGLYWSDAILASLTSADIRSVALAGIDRVLAHYLAPSIRVLVVNARDALRAGKHPDKAATVLGNAAADRNNSSADILRCVRSYCFACGDGNSLPDPNAVLTPMQRSLLFAMRAECLAFITRVVVDQQWHDLLRALRS